MMFARTLFIVGMLTVAAGWNCGATVYYVGGNSNGPTWFSGTWTNLQAAFSAAVAGDEVRISGDVVRPAGEIGIRDLKLSNSGAEGARIVVSGGWDASFVTAPGAVARSVINAMMDGTANNSNRCLTVSGNYVTVRNVTLTGGDDLWGTTLGANFVSGNYCVFSRVTVTNNNTDSINEGRTEGGLRWNGDSGVIEHCLVGANRGGTCGGLAMETAYYTVVANCEIVGNWCSSFGAAGLRMAHDSGSNQPTVVFGSRIAMNYHLGTAVLNAYGDSSNGGIGYTGPNDQTLPGNCLVNCTVADNGRCIDLGLAEGGSSQAQYFLNSIIANNNGKNGIESYCYGANRDISPNDWNWNTSTWENPSVTGHRGWIGFLSTCVNNDMGLGFGHYANQADWGPPNTNTSPNSNILADPKFVNAPRFRDGATANGSTTQIYVSSNLAYAVNDIVEINRDGVPRKITGTGIDGTGSYIIIDTALGSSSARYTGPATTTFIENWGPLKSAKDLSMRKYNLDRTSPCVDSGAVAVGSGFRYVDVNQNGSYDWGLDMIVALDGYTPVSMNTPNPTYYDLVYTTDLAGNARVKNNKIDRGAYEFRVGGMVITLR
ncbi:MAG: hypothetical protein C0404_09575 [Verrucomicrobia bacterium]|nr:hypothetical protein [Verrucomicrobiota bacterium]